MPQVTIYVPDDLLQRLKGEARKSRKSLSAYLTELARSQLQPQRWPRDFFDLAGSCPDLREPEDSPPEPVDL